MKWRGATCFRYLVRVRVRYKMNYYFRLRLFIHLISLHTEPDLSQLQYAEMNISLGTHH